MSEKIFALIDCNSFYASCERIFRPELKNRPVIVLSNNDGCAIARTQEAKDLGIKMGDPYFKIKALCQKHNVAIFSSNFSLYTNMSDRVMGTLAQNCPQLEIYSVDEAFADLTGISDLHGHGKKLRELVYKNIGIPVGVGIAPTKVLAKVANHIAKKSQKAEGVVLLTDPYLQDVALKRTPVDDIWGVGRANSEKMRSLGIHTAYDLKVFKNEQLIQKIFTKVGLQIKHELMGIRCFDLEQDVEAKKEIMCSRTFGTYLCDKKNLEEALANYVENAAAKMRAQGSVCLELAVFARTNPFREGSQYHMYEREKLFNPTCDTRKLIGLALKLLRRGYREGYEYRKAGVRLSRFFDSSEYQIDFLHPADNLRDVRLMRAIDFINHREGEGTIKFAACGLTDKAWKMNRNFKSPRYTTSWQDLPLF